MSSNKLRKQPVEKEVLFLFRLNKSGEVVSIKNTVSVAAGKNYTRNFFRAFAKAEHFVRRSYFTQNISRIGYIACDNLYPDLKDILPVIERANKPFWAWDWSDVMTPALAKDIAKDIVRMQLGEANPHCCPQCGKSKRNNSVAHCEYTNCPLAGKGDKR